MGERWGGGGGVEEGVKGFCISDCSSNEGWGDRMEIVNKELQGPL